MPILSEKVFKCGKKNMYDIPTMNNIRLKSVFNDCDKIVFQINLGRFIAYPVIVIVR